MAVPGPKLLLVLSATVCFIGLYQVEGAAQSPSPQDDGSSCVDQLQVIYPRVAICINFVIPKEMRKEISTVWGAPEIYFPKADEAKKYVLLMVDPDAPSHRNPTQASWRHWLVVNIKGSELKKGNMVGTTLTDYARPTPPVNSGEHRYQFYLFVQPANKVPSLTEEEKSKRGKWDPEGFINTFKLGNPVASLQFVTQNYNN